MSHKLHTWLLLAHVSLEAIKKSFSVNMGYTPTDIAVELAYNKGLREFMIRQILMI